MFVDVEQMRAGANKSYAAAGFADEGVQALSRGRVCAGMFGDFAAAELFSTGIDGAHTQHATRLRNQERRLGVLGDKTHVTASCFVDMERRNTEALQAVKWSLTQA
ncbi:hypothetical protein MCHIJ_03800 [Mycolicibacterium chitae]|uniref:Protein of uncharacterized function (DUF2563) n=1 Tax=Mycolicibacterium chitae TaxID=1792 RepID=A0A3S4T397_MYCCI|nr:DUF2563 family protein [Mycolicibacterium chitae]BBZ00943.1 hypothetical protein MCHIJ_03800 [Mycolicibacterium chitae]VEG49790.1 Protein of uncharacterised function (DUF2563) [Mycolicibacterium chitae]